MLERNVDDKEEIQMEQKITRGVKILSSDYIILGLV
jgi:hypothetical protein